jgi:pimeloyl-ACP methyl ester carboxylesterase
LVLLWLPGRYHIAAALVKVAREAGLGSFISDGVEIAYAVHGQGDPVLLIHGFASNGFVNWRSTGWVDLLEKAGRMVITIDNRGHGASAKPTTPAAYEPRAMAEDSRALLDHLAVPQADVIGYSMGARLAAILAIRHQERVRSLVLGGLAANLIHGLSGGAEIAAALLAPELSAVQGSTGRAFRMFAEQTRSDLPALAACIQASRQQIAVEELAAIRCPVLVVAGSNDEIAGPLAPLVEAIPGAEGLSLKGRDHMKAVGDREFKLAVLDFLDRRP